MAMTDMQLCWNEWKNSVKNNVDRYYIENIMVQ